MVFQNYALYPHMTVFDNIGFALKLARVPKPETDSRVRKAAAILELEPYLDRKPGLLSGGQRQRVAMGRAIVRQPSAFLMDEPLSNLDAKLRVQMRAEIARGHSYDIQGVASRHPCRSKRRVLPCDRTREENAWPRSTQVVRSTPLTEATRRCHHSRCRPIGPVPAQPDPRRGAGARQRYRAGSRRASRAPRNPDLPDHHRSRPRRSQPPAIGRREAAATLRP